MFVIRIKNASAEELATPSVNKARKMLKQRRCRTK